MTKILAFGDLHLGAGTDHRQDALADHEKALTAIADAAFDHQVDVVLNAGDTFDKPHPSIAALHVWRRFVHRLEVIDKPLITILGNSGHDQVNADRPSAVELSEGRRHTVATEPRVITIVPNDFAICCLPNVPLNRLIAHIDIADLSQVDRIAVGLVMDKARKLRERAGKTPALLLGHWSVSGADLPNGMAVEDLREPVLPLDELGELGFDACAFGHIHRARQFHEDAPVLYVGSPMTLNFGEAKEHHGYWLLEVDANDTRVDFVEIPGRPFVTIDATVPETMGDDWFDILPAYDVRDAVVRVRIRGTSDQLRRVDAQRTLHNLLTAGAHKVYGGIQLERTDADRVRVAEAVETVAPLEAVGMWSRVQKLAAQEDAALLGLTSDYLDAA